MTDDTKEYIKYWIVWIVGLASGSFLTLLFQRIFL